MKGRACPQCKKEIPFNILIKNGFKKKKPIKCPECSTEFVYDMKNWRQWGLICLPGSIFIFWYLFAIFTKRIPEHSIFSYLIYVACGFVYIGMMLCIKRTKLIKIN